MKATRKVNFLWALILFIIYIGILFLIQFGIIRSYYQVAIVTIGINIILGLGLNLIIGVAGQFSLGHAGFMAIGAYSAAVVLIKMPTILGLIIGMIIGMVIAGLVALIVGIPTLRLKGDYLAIATLGIAEIIRIVILNLNGITNGAVGISNIPKLTNWTLVFVCVVGTTLFITNYIFSSSGRATLAIREDEIAAESVGINTLKYKTMAFVIGAITASVAGALYASYFSVIKPDVFGFMKSIDILVIVVFGGIGSLTGTIIAAIVLGLINLFLQSYSELRMILYAVSLIAIMIFRPGGLLNRKEFKLTNIVNKLSFKKEAK